MLEKKDFSISLLILGALHFHFSFMTAAVVIWATGVPLDLHATSGGGISDACHLYNSALFIWTTWNLIQRNYRRLLACDSRTVLLPINNNPQNQWMRIMVMYTEPKLGPNTVNQSKRYTKSKLIFKNFFSIFQHL